MFNTCKNFKNCHMHTMLHAISAFTYEPVNTSNTWEICTSRTHTFFPTLHVWCSYTCSSCRQWNADILQLIGFFIFCNEHFLKVLLKKRGLTKYAGIFSCHWLKIVYCTAQKQSASLKSILIIASNAFTLSVTQLRIYNTLRHGHYPRITVDNQKRNNQ